MDCSKDSFDKDLTPPGSHTQSSPLNVDAKIWSSILAARLNDSIVKYINIRFSERQQTLED